MGAAFGLRFYRIAYCIALAQTAFSIFRVRQGRSVKVDTADNIPGGNAVPAVQCARAVSGGIVNQHRCGDLTSACKHGCAYAGKAVAAAGGGQSGRAIFLFAFLPRADWYCIIRWIRNFALNIKNFGFSHSILSNYVLYCFQKCS